MSETAPALQRFVHPDTVVTHFHIRPGEVVADYGAGSGYFIPRLAAATGVEGVVFACEIQKNLIEALGELTRTKHLDQVRVIWCDLEAPGGVAINDGTVDVGVIVNTLFQLEDKATAIKEVIRTLTQGGRLYVIDWSESFGGLGPQPTDVLSEQAVRSLCETAGLIFERSYDAGDHHYGLAFRKP